MKKTFTNVFIDFETRSFADLPKTGAWTYSKHPTTDIFCMAYRTDRMQRAKLWTPGTKLPDIFYKDNINIVARNALFEYAMIANVAVNKYGFPERLLDIERWYCTRALSLTVGMPGGLGKCAIALNVDTKKMAVGAHLINKYSKPKTNKKTGEKYFIKLEGEDEKLMYDYCLADVNADYECYQKLHKLNNNKLERKIFLLDFKQNIQGVNVDKEGLTHVMTALNEAQEQAEKEMDAIGVNVRSPKQMKEHFEAEGYPLKDLKVDTVNAALRDNSVTGTLRRLLELRLFLGKASVKKYKALKTQLGQDDKVRYFLRYFGSSTGRFSSVGTQLHNMPKSGVKDLTSEVIEDIISHFHKDMQQMEMIKESKIVFPGLLVAPKDHTFIMGDFAAIEARGIAYLAGQTDMLEAFRRGEDIYKVMAADLLKKPVSQITKQERQLGKIIILACSYSMGHVTFMATCENWGMPITKQLAEKAVNAYRKKYSKIRNFWYDLQNAFDTCYINRHKGKNVKVGEYITVRSTKNFIAVLLPNGRELFYHRVEKKGNDMSYWNHQRGARIKLYGGIIAENITQGMCRDILCDRMVKCEEQGLNTVFHVHDELICLTETKKKSENQGIFDAIMNTAPEWLPGFPLLTESELSYRYHK